MRYKKFFAAVTSAAMMFGIAPFSALALHVPEHYTLFSDADYVSPGNASDRAVRLVSDSDALGISGVEFDLEPGMTFADLTTLSTDYRLEADDMCGGGSPRFQVAVVEPEYGDVLNIFVYFGTPPNYNDCPAGAWVNTGNLLGILPVDTSQLPGGTFYDPYASALLKYGDYTVVAVQVVADGGWAATDGEQTVDVDNTLINETLFTYEASPSPVPTNKDQCKQGGWQTLADDEGNSFKNQGDCVSFVATKGKNKGSGN